MWYKLPVNFLILFLMVLSSAILRAQSDDAFTCFNAQEIHFPLGQNDFTGNEILLNDHKVNALYYLYQDKYSFWYKFVADEAVQIDFSVSPSNSNDRYRAVVFKYGGKDFCDKLIQDNMQPIEVPRAPIFNKDGGITYRNTLTAAKGDTFYVSVLSLNRDDCGHYLYVESGGQNLSIHAIHGPCYNFTQLEVPDFGAAKMFADDVDLNLDLADDDANSPGYAALSSVEVQEKEEGLISVGDRLVLNNVFFYNNTYAFKPGAEHELNQLVDFLKANPTVNIQIQGHTANHASDIRPDPNYKGQGKEWNFKGSAMELSEKRALEVEAYLLKHGIDKGRLRAVGYGDTKKRFPDAKTFEESEKNMRVEAVVTKQ